MRRMLLAGVVPLALVLLAIGGGLARAASCDTSWNVPSDGDWSNPSNWTHGVPTKDTNACITLSGTYSVNISGILAEAKSLQLGGSSGTQTLEIGGMGAVSGEASLSLVAGGSISASGFVLLTDACPTAGCTPSPAASLVNHGTTPLTNAGEMEAFPGVDQGANDRQLAGDITNTGTISVEAPLQYVGGVLDNRGTISLGNQVMSLLYDAVPPAVSATVRDDTGGTITNGGGTGDVLVGFGNTFIQGGGTTSPASANPSHPAVVVSDPAYTNPLPTLRYAGSGASAVLAQGGLKLAGNLGPGQSLVIDGAQNPGCHPAQATSTGGIVNAGTIMLSGPCGSGLVLSAGTLTNRGTLLAAAGATRSLQGEADNAGSLTIDGSLVVTGQGGPLFQIGGTTTVAAGQTLELNGGSGTFALQGGLLDSPGSRATKQGVINGSVDNTGGDVAPGTPTAPGEMTVDGSYTQGSGGRFTAVVGGKSVGTGYSQLSTLGSMTVAGLLAIKPRSGYRPRVGTEYTVLGSHSGHLSGRFSTVTGQFGPQGPFPPGWTTGLEPHYAAHGVFLEGAAAAGLRVRRAGTGSGTITSSPSGISCGKTCTAPFFQTQTVTLTAHPARGSAFRDWSGACSGTRRTCRVKINRARTATASFKRG